MHFSNYCKKLREKVVLLSGGGKILFVFKDVILIWFCLQYCTIWLASFAEFSSSRFRGFVVLLFVCLLKGFNIFLDLPLSMICVYYDLSMESLVYLRDLSPSLTILICLSLWSILKLYPENLWENLCSVSILLLYSTTSLPEASSDLFLVFICHYSCSVNLFISDFLWSLHVGFISVSNCALSDSTVGTGIWYIQIHYTK